MNLSRGFFITNQILDVEIHVKVEPGFVFKYDVQIVAGHDHLIGRRVLDLPSREAVSRWVIAEAQGAGVPKPRVRFTDV